MLDVVSAVMCKSGPCGRVLCGNCNWRWDFCGIRESNFFGGYSSSCEKHIDLALNPLAPELFF